ncbi:class I SAM-dependent methyltransferase [Rhodocista pekingensis]|uniref:Class I SAM-dependent methyltransferase n=1 Tax=Rhodocista pekingensis TaxID=201185 RepID=A0ABW2KQU6_9PROT
MPVGLLSPGTGSPPIEVGDENILIKAELAPEILSVPDRGLGEWIARRYLKEVRDDLLHADRLMRSFVPGSHRPPIATSLIEDCEQVDPTALVISGQQVMQSWERPYMEAMAREAGRQRGDVLEIGFGMGISATFLQEYGVRSHTIVECHPDVLRRAESWRENYPNRNISIIPGTWQDTRCNFGEYDAILFDAYPLTEGEQFSHYVNDVTYAAHFFQTASEHLRSGGVFTYYSNEIDSIGRGHQRSLMKWFRRVSVEVIKDLTPPEDCHYWQADRILLVVATR